MRAAIALWTLMLVLLAWSYFMEDRAARERLNFEREMVSCFLDKRQQTTQEAYERCYPDSGELLIGFNVKRVRWEPLEVGPGQP